MRRPSVPAIAVIVLLAIASTAIAFVVALAMALGDFPWELSINNLGYAMREGALWGIPGGLLAALLCSAAKHKLLAATGLLAAWGTIAATCYFFYVSIYFMG